MAEPDFRYSREIRSAAIEWRLLIASGDITPQELRAFEDWRQADPRHADAYDRATSVWTALGTLGRESIDADHFELSLAERLSERTRTMKAALLSPGRIIIGAIASLALIALGVMTFPSVPSSQTTLIAEASKVSEHNSETGQIEVVELSDGSRVTLGADTEITAAMYADKRVITLTRGAAIFEVEPDANRPFSVKAERFTATALGTTFDVRSNGGVARLSVAEGRVAASYPLIVNDAPSSLFRRQELTAGQQVSASETSGLSNVSQFQTERFAAWREGRLAYEGATLGELIADANRYSDLPIRFDDDLTDLARKRITMTVNAGNIDAMLALLADIFPIDISRTTDGEILVTKAPT